MTIHNNHREEEDQEGNDSSDIETLTYHVLATYGLFLSSFATFDMSIIVIMYNDNISTHPLNVQCTTITYRLIRCTSNVKENQEKDKIGSKPDKNGKRGEAGKSQKQRSNRRCIPNIVEPEIRTIEEIVSMADRTMEELLQAPTEGYGEAIMISEILAEIFEIKTNLLQDVPNDAIKLMLFSYSLEGAARIWYEKEPPNSILTWDDLVNKFVNQFFPPSKTTHLKNEISRFTQRFKETFGEAWDRFKEMLKACSHQGFSELTQIDTFYNGLTEQDQNSLNAASGDNLLNKTTREALKIIENKSKVRYSKSKSNVSRVNTNSKDNVSKIDDRIDKLADQISNLVEIVNKKIIVPAKAIEKTCVTCGGAHAYYDCIATDSNQSSVCAATGSYNQVFPPNRASHQIPPPGFALVQNNPNRFNQNQVPNNQIQPSVRNEFSSYMKSNEIMIKSMQNHIYVLWGDFNKQEENLRRNLNHDMRTILGSFFQNHPLTLGTLPSNNVPNPKVQPPVVPISIPEPDVLRTQTKPTIPYPSRDGELTPTRMTLELADRSITHPKRVDEDVFFKVGKFHFPTDFVVVDFEVDQRVPLILRRSFLRTNRALIDVYREEITLRVNDESVTFNLNQTMRYSLTYDDTSVNRVDVIDIACEEFVHDVLDFQYNSKSSSPTLGDILFLEKLLNEDPFQLPLIDLKLVEESKAKSSVEEPPELELKELPSHLEYAFLKDSNKLPVIISKNLKDVEREALINVLKSHKRAIAWKISDIKILYSQNLNGGRLQTSSSELKNARGIKKTKKRTKSDKNRTKTES
nr:reverse transcriptase domain-containing protein [Tanacetum cinerariifolium]